jgi:FtsZ-binding cell division protein ZapB
MGMGIEEKITKLEKIFDKGEDVVRECQIEFLNDLKEIRRSLDQDQGAKGQGELVKEIEELKEENRRLVYRIEHMKKFIN